MKLLSILFAILLSVTLSFSQTYLLESFVETNLYSDGDSSSAKLDFKYKTDQTFDKFEVYELDSTSWVLEYCSSTEYNENGDQNAFYTSDAINKLSLIHI